jgi:hypothetical protein
MAVTAHATGTLSTTGSSTEDFLTSPAVAGTFTLHVDTNDMAGGDTIIVRVYQIVLTGGTTRVVYAQQYANAQAANDLIKISVPVSNELTDANSLRFSITQTKGTAGISLPWKVLRYA